LAPSIACYGPPYQHVLALHCAALISPIGLCISVPPEIIRPDLVAAGDDLIHQLRHEQGVIVSMAVHGGGFGGRISIIGCVQPVAMSEQSEQESREAELRRRITLHLKVRASSDPVVLLWHGYIAGLLIPIQSSDRRIKLLPEIGRTELAEIFLGFEEDSGT
jgi:hypothetical protein